MIYRLSTKRWVIFAANVCFSRDLFQGSGKPSFAFICFCIDLASFFQFEVCPIEKEEWLVGFSRSLSLSFAKPETFVWLCKSEIVRWSREESKTPNEQIPNPITESLRSNDQRIISLCFFLVFDAFQAFFFRQSRWERAVRPIETKELLLFSQYQLL